MNYLLDQVIFLKSTFRTYNNEPPVWAPNWSGTLKYYSMRPGFEFGQHFNVEEDGELEGDPWISSPQN